MKDNKKILFGIGIAFLFLATIGFSYAYFTATLVNKDVKDQVVETGTLSLKYTDGTAINGVNISPGWTATKTITIENTGTLDAFYTIFWKDLVNEITNDELVMSLECESSTDTCATINFQNQTVPSSKNAISENIIIYPGEVQTITLNFEFKALYKAQDYNQGKKFNGVINIEDSTKIAFQTEYTMYTRVIDQNDNPLANMTVELHSDVKSGITDENGYVRISGIVPGKHELYVKDSNGNTLDTKNIEITQKKESDITNDSIIYIDSSLTEFTNTIKLTDDNKLDSIENLIIPPNECFDTRTYNDEITIYRYYAEKDNCPLELQIPDTIDGVKVTGLFGSYLCEEKSYESSFANKGIKKINLTNNIKSIGTGSLAYNKLTSIIVPSSVEYIGGKAFERNQLINVYIQNGVKNIGNYAFQNNKIVNLTLSNSITSIGKESFLNNHIENLNIPESVTSIGDEAFENNNLKQVTIQGKSSSSDFTTYYPNWGWASDVTCVKDNTSNVTNGCITWKIN